VPKPSVALAADYIKIDPSKPDDGDPWFDDNYKRDLGDFLGRQRTIEGLEDGTFRLPDLAAGTYVLTVMGGSGAPKTVKGVRVESGATRDLGEIVLDDAGTLHGRIVLGPDQVSAEISVRLDDDWGRGVPPTGKDLEFSFENLTLGDHVLHVNFAGSGFQDGVDQPFTVAAGKTAEIVVDLASKSPCKVRIRAMSGAEPRPGVEVEWERLTDGRASQGGRIGVTDAQGIAAGSVPGGVDARFVAKAASGFVIGCSAAPVHLGAAALLEADIELHSGELAIDFPETLEIPEQAMFNVTLRGPGDDMQMTNWGTPRSRFHMSEHRWTSRHCVLGGIAPGEYQVWIDAQSLGDPTRYVALVERFESKIKIVENETLTLQIKP
jgi:hypothetical protein